MRVLIIEDNHSTAKTIELALLKENMQCDISSLGHEGYEISALYDYDLIILDLVLPDTNGLEILKKLRNSKKVVPVLIISGLASSEDKIKGLGYGADDYLTKPFDMAELVARIKAIVRRSKGHSDSTIEIGNLKINLNDHTTTVMNNMIHLTHKEQAIIELLALRRGHAVSKEQFLDHLYNGMDEPELKIIDVFVCRLRRKLSKASNGFDYIGTSWGRGYILKAHDLPH